MNWDETQTFEAFLADWDRSAQDRDFTLSNGESSRSAGERMRAFVAGLAGGPGPVAAVSHGGVTTDLLRTLLGDEALPPRVLAGGIPPCAVTTLDGLYVVAIASTRHLEYAHCPALEEGARPGPKRGRLLPGEVVPGYLPACPARRPGWLMPRVARTRVASRAW